MERSGIPALTSQELLELMPEGTGASLLAVERPRWLAYRAASELALARERLTLAKSLLSDVRAALGDDEVSRAAIAERIDAVMRLI